MKAKIKKTGEIVNLASHAMITLDQCDSWGNPKTYPNEIAEFAMACANALIEQLKMK